MRLDLGGIEAIDDPTPDQVAHYLQFMPAESPFIVLERREGDFIQALIEEGKYRVEYKENKSQWFVIVGYEKARDLFWCYMDESCELAEATAWTRLTALNTPWHPAAVIGLILLIVCFTIFAVCNELGLL